MSNEFQIDIDLTYSAARARWFKESAPRRALADWFALITPWSIVIVFAAGHALSAPHTANVMNLITPGMGFIAPIAVEFALIWSAFEIRRARSAQTTPLPAARFLRWFMLIIAVATNATGGLSAVVDGTGVTDLSAEALWGAFSGLPLVTQVALLMVIVAALAVPITAEATGVRLRNWSSSAAPVKTSANRHGKVWRLSRPRELLMCSTTCPDTRPTSRASWLFQPYAVTSLRVQAKGL